MGNLLQKVLTDPTARTPDALQSCAADVASEMVPWSELSA